MVTTSGWFRVIAAATAMTFLVTACADDAAQTSTTSQASDESAATTTASTAIVEPTTTSSTDPSPPALDADDTSPENTAAVGQTVQVGDWRVRVVSITPDATDILLQNEFNDPPGVDEQYFTAGLEATYTGTGIGDFFFDLTTTSMGASATYDSPESSCAFPPDDINQVGEVFPGGTIFGNVCWKIQSADTQSMVLIVDEFGTFDDMAAYLSMDPSAEVADDTTSIGPARIDTSEAAALGESQEVNDWQIRVLDVVPNANEAIIAEATFNEEPSADHQYFIVSVEGTYVGEESGHLWDDLSFEAVGQEGLIYSSFNAECGFVPDGLAFTDEASPGETVVGNVCWEVRTADLESLTMLAGEFTAADVPRTMMTLSS